MILCQDCQTGYACEEWLGTGSGTHSVGLLEVLCDGRVGGGGAVRVEEGDELGCASCCDLAVVKAHGHIRHEQGCVLQATQTQFGDNLDDACSIKVSLLSQDCLP